MKIAVINFSGNVGKTSVSRHLIAPRINAKVVAVESINGDEIESDAVKGKHFSQLMEAVAVMDRVVCDIGASNVEVFINKMREYAGSHEDFDYYIIPCIPRNKQNRDTIATIEALAEIGVPAEKIRVLFNMVDPEDDANHLFEPILNYYKAEHKFTFVKDAVIHINDLFGKLSPGSSIAEIVADDTDYKALMKTATTSIEKQKISRQIGLKRLAVGFKDKLDQVFDSLFAEA